jgi:hypothetical protein
MESPSNVIFKPIHPAKVDGGRVRFLSPREVLRGQHALEYHGTTFYSEVVHRSEHRKNDIAIRILKGELSGILEVMKYVEDVTMVKHDHAESDY